MDTGTIKKQESLYALLMLSLYLKINLNLDGSKLIERIDAIQKLLQFLSPKEYRKLDVLLSIYTDSLKCIDEPFDEIHNQMVADLAYLYVSLEENKEFEANILAVFKETVDFIK